MRRLSVSVVVLLLVSAAGVGWWFLRPAVDAPVLPPAYLGQTDGVQAPTSSTPTRSTSTAPRTEVIAENLTIPWEVLFLPDGELLVTERPGTLLLLTQGVELVVDGVRHIGEGGLLGAALHPDFAENNFLYLYQTTETADGLQNRVVRYTLRGTTLTRERVIIDALPGARYHDGGRIAFGSDGMLYVSVGDATDAAAAQDTSNRAGTILRLTPEGAVPPDNPLPNSPIYSYGHRNAQGLTWDASGRLWSSEHGRSVLGSGFDEINLIEPGGNYGWPDSQGDEVADGTIGPVRHSTADVTWAPGDLAYHEGRLYLPGLRGETLYVATISGGTVTDWQEYLVGEYGRLRTVQVGPDGLLYLTTSNRDGRGTSAPRDDRIIRLNPAKL